MKPVSLDTNILLRWLLRDIDKQAKAADRLFSSQKTLAVADLTISELVYVLEKAAGMPRQLIADNVLAILEQANINCNRALFNKVIPLYVKHQGLSFNDCCLAIYAELNQAVPLYTFDKKLDKQLTHTKLLT